MRRVPFVAFLAVFFLALPGARALGQCPTTTTTLPPCRLTADQGGPVCAGLCQNPGDVCLFDRGVNTCRCAPPSARCDHQPDTSCAPGLCFRPTDRCQDIGPNCGCLP